MGFWTLLEVACMPTFQVLIISVLGAFMATEYWNLLPVDARRSMNKVVFVVFTPSLVFASVAKTITFEDIISMWFMIVNVGLTFLFGGILGWILVKIVRPKPYQEGLVMAACSSEDGNPFGDHSVCKRVGLSYVSFSMALGGFFIWTYSYQLIRTSAMKWKALQAIEAAEEASKNPNSDLDAEGETPLLKGEDEEQGSIVVSSNGSRNQEAIVADESDVPFSRKVVAFVKQILHELLAPPTVAAIVGFFIGSIPFLKKIIIGDSAPLRVIEDSITQLGNGTIPCITLILGGNLIQGLRKSTIKIPIIIGVIIVRYVFTLPPAMNIGTMTQLFDVAEAECSVIFLWTYLVAALALTIWSTVYMWLLS
ncbi:hypothetical protein PRUPE_7G185200 [Prunus persica]|uniref:Auxin efflux carrier n=1 Tax=Prunus persica TaxID=3760 RepID=A0A251NFD4_PRUPE|nr:hypothetical protein PRUPE_7G185200 [Prunus persica]